MNVTTELILLIPLIIPIIVFFFYRNYVKKAMRSQAFANELYHKNILINGYWIFFLIMYFGINIFVMLVDPNTINNVQQVMISGEINESLLIYSILTYVVFSTSYFVYVLCRKKINYTIARFAFLTQSLERRITISRWCGLVLWFLCFMFIVPLTFNMVQIVFSLAMSNPLFFIPAIGLIFTICMTFYAIFLGLKNFIDARVLKNYPVYRPQMVNENALMTLKNPMLKLDIQSFTIFADQKTYLPEVTINKETFFQLISPNTKDVMSFVLVYPMFISLFEHDINYEGEKAYITISGEEMIAKIKQQKEQNENQL